MPFVMLSPMPGTLTGVDPAGAAKKRRGAAGAAAEGAAGEKLGKLRAASGLLQPSRCRAARDADRANRRVSDDDIFDRRGSGRPKSGERRW